MGKKPMVISAYLSLFVTYSGAKPKEFWGEKVLFTDKKGRVTLFKGAVKR